MSAAEKVIELLKARRRAPTLEIVKATGLSWDEAIETLFTLENGGAVSRAEVLDLTKPIATAVWELRAEGAPESAEGRELGSVVSLILNPPLLRDLGSPPPASMGLLDSLSYAVSSASRSLRIAMPYVGDLMSALFAQHVQDLKRLSLLRVITEDTRSNRRALEPMRLFLPNLEVRYATKESGGVKVVGAHLKLIIADEDLAIIGTFNLTQAHLLVNYDVGVLLRGGVVRHLTAIFDAIWNKIVGGAGEQA
ncbi:MAG: phospholipase D-like domain-containing protein [Nitrososphaerota archaeon]